MKIKKLLIPLLLLLSCVFAFTGCSNKYNADLTCKFYNELNEWCKSEFLETNKVYGAAYPFENEDGEVIPNYVEDKETPRYRCILVKTNEEYDKIFIGNPISVNFDKQMLIICTCAVINNRKIKISDIRLNDDNMLIKFKSIKPTGNIADTSMPTQKYLFVVMDKLDTHSISFELET